jgi:peptidyl-prolyl cis-trans isomerase C
MFLYILVKKQSEADTILEMAKKDRSIAKLAQELNLDKRSEKRGGGSRDLDLFAKGMMMMMIKPFEESPPKIKKLEITSEPLKLEFGYHIIKR